MHTQQPAILIDLTTLDTNPAGGPQWSHESDDLDLTLLAWSGTQRVAPHTNSEVDVLMIAVAGRGQVSVDGADFQLGPGQALLIARGAERSIQCLGASFAYLSVHRRRRGLWPTIAGRPLD